MLGWRVATALAPRAAAAAAVAAKQHRLCDFLGGSTAAVASAAPPQRATSGLQRHCLHATAGACALLGIVEQLRDACKAGVADAAAASMREMRWEVVEFAPDGGTRETTASPESLGLHPRDVYLFDGEAATGLGSGSMLAPRGGHYVFITPGCRAMVAADRAVLWPGQREADTVKMAQSVRDYVAAQPGLPFQLRVLEALLCETARGYATTARRLALVADTVLADIGAGGGLAGQTSTGELQRLIPIERQLTHMQNEVADVIGAIAQVGNSEATTRRLCLSQGAGAAAAPGQAPADDDAALASAILNAYEAKLYSAQLVLREALAGIDQMRTSWHMSLDHQRNRVLRVDLFVGVMSLCAVVSSMPAAYMGMNLQSGLEETPGLFWPVVQTSLAVGALLAGSMWLYYRIGPQWRYARRMRDIDSLRDLLMHHLQDLGEVMAAAKAHRRSAPTATMSKGEFAALVRGTVAGGRPMSNREIELLYRVLDADADGMLELSDMERLESRIQSQLGDSREG